jgi:hypothetical protein
VNPGELEHLAQRFSDRTLPKAEWTHAAHLRVGLWHVLHHGPEEALRLLRERIRAYNEVVGVPNTDHGGYHETITRFYLRQIAHFVDQADRSRPINELADALVAALGDKGLLFEFYSRQRLDSVEARRRWVEPDLQPLG